jgi:hypothetical protein
MTWSAPSELTSSTFPRAAHTGYLRAERVGDLNRERPNASRRAVDENPRARCDLPTSRIAIKAVIPDMTDAPAL